MNQPTINLSFQKMFFAIGSVCLLFAILVFAKTILVPMGFALLISFILFPMTRKFESWGINRMVAAFFSILVLFMVLAAGGYFFFSQIINMPNELSVFQDKIMDLLRNVTLFINKNFNLKSDLEMEQLIDQMNKWLQNAALPLAENTFYTTTGVLTGLLLTIIYIYLLLIYRNGITRALILFSREENRETALEMLRRVQRVGQKYLSGMLILIIILGVANSIGLWLIGIDSPFLFGFLAAVMSIIPYVGTTIGAAIPILYAFMTKDSLWIPFMVAFMFWFVQLIETNFLSPKVVGSSLQINALAALLSLIIGASVWGIAGMVLFLPFAAMLKVLCEVYAPLKPLSYLLGSHIYYGIDHDEVNPPLPGWFLKMKGGFSTFPKRFMAMKRRKRKSDASS